jgi:hypothetical protein
MNAYHTWTVSRHDRTGSAWLVTHTNNVDTSQDNFAFTSLEHARQFIASKRNNKRIRLTKLDVSHYRYVYKSPVA